MRGLQTIVTCVRMGRRSPHRTAAQEPTAPTLTNPDRSSLFQAHSDLSFTAKHDEGIAINHANDWPLERFGVGRLCEND
jgi:hypothetical protein